MSSVEVINAIERERSNAQKIVLRAIEKLHTEAADKAEILGRHGYKNIPILFEKVEVERMLWAIAKAIRHEEEKNPQ